MVSIGLLSGETRCGIKRMNKQLSVCCRGISFDCVCVYTEHFNPV